MTINPVFVLMTRGDKGPSARAARWIGAAVTVLSLIVLAARIFNCDYLYPWIDLVPYVGVLILVLLCIPAGFTTGANLAAKYAADQNFALVRMTPLTAEDIVEGCARATGYRLRLLWSLTFWMLPSAWAGMIALANMTFWIDYVPIPQEYYSPYAYVASLIGPDVLISTVMLMLILYLSLRLAVSLGVWLGLRWPGAARAAAAIGVIAGSLALCLAAARLQAPILVTLRVGVNLLSQRLVAYGAPFLLIIAAQLVYNDAIIYLEDHMPQPSSVSVP